MKGQVRRREGHRDEQSSSRRRGCKWNDVGLFLVDGEEREARESFGCHPAEGQEAIEGGSCASGNAFAIQRADASSPARKGQHGKANGPNAGTAHASTE